MHCDKQSWKPDCSVKRLDIDRHHMGSECSSYQQPSTSTVGSREYNPCCCCRPYPVTCTIHHTTATIRTTTKRNISPPNKSLRVDWHAKHDRDGTIRWGRRSVGDGAVNANLSTPQELRSARHKAIHDRDTKSAPH